MIPSRRSLVLAAGALSLVSTALLLGLAAREHAGPPEATLVLTERELRLTALGEERAWASLRLDWNREEQWREKAPGWFDAGKLGELGFATRRAPSDVDAASYYAWQPPRTVWVILELGEPEPGAKDPAGRSRLHVVDASLDPGELRARHPDRNRSAVVRAVVSAQLRRPREPGTKEQGPPFIRGSVDDLLEEEIQLPREKRSLLDRLAAADAAKNGSPARTGEPRYGAIVRFSARGAPTVESVRSLGP